MKAKRIEFRQGDALFVFTLNTTRNKKIAGKDEKIFQTYSYSRQQYEHERNIKSNTSKRIPLRLHRQKPSRLHETERGRAMGINPV